MHQTQRPRRSPEAPQEGAHSGSQPCTKTRQMRILQAQTKLCRLVIHYAFTSDVCHPYSRSNLCFLALLQIGACSPAGVKARKGLSGACQELHTHRERASGEVAAVRVPGQAQQEARHAVPLDPAHQRRQQRARREYSSLSLSRASFANHLSLLQILC